MFKKINLYFWEKYAAVCAIAGLFPLDVDVYCPLSALKVDIKSALNK